MQKFIVAYILVACVVLHYVIKLCKPTSSVEHMAPCIINAVTLATPCNKTILKHPDTCPLTGPHVSMLFVLYGASLVAWAYLSTSPLELKVRRGLGLCNIVLACTVILALGHVLKTILATYVAMAVAAVIGVYWIEV